MLFSTPILDMAMGGGVLSYISHIRICRPKGYGIWAVWVVLKHFAHFAGFGIGYGFQGTYGSVHVRMYLSFSILNEQERNRSMRI